MTPPGVSLKRHGLRLRESLECPAGGPHDVPKAAVVIALAAGVPPEGSGVTCLKCRERLTLERLDVS